MYLLQPQEVFATQPALYFLGLDDALLDVAEAYLGAPCLYIGPTLKREPVDGKEQGTRKWHIDVQDEHIVRLIIYLTSVTWEDGPFEYVGALETAIFRSKGGYKGGYMDDRLLQHSGFSHNRRSCIGEAGTAILFDGAHVLHRARPPARNERLSVTYTYLTRHPLQIFHESRLSQAAKAAICSQLGGRHAACIPPARLF